jgi:hypothetical protein
MARDVSGIENRLFVLPGKAAGTNEGLREVLEPVIPKKKHPSHRRHFMPLMHRHQLQVAQVALPQSAELGKTLGGSSEVQRFRAHACKRFLIKGASLDGPPKFIHLSGYDPISSLSNAAEQFSRTHYLNAERLFEFQGVAIVSDRGPANQPG